MFCNMLLFGILFWNFLQLSLQGTCPEEYHRCIYHGSCCKDGYLCGLGDMCITYLGQICIVIGAIVGLVVVFFWCMWLRDDFRTPDKKIQGDTTNDTNNAQ